MVPWNYINRDLRYSTPCVRSGSEHEHTAGDLDSKSKFRLKTHDYSRHYSNSLVTIQIRVTIQIPRHYSNSEYEQCSSTHGSGSITLLFKTLCRSLCREYFTILSPLMDAELNKKYWKHYLHKNAFRSLDISAWNNFEYFERFCNVFQHISSILNL
jgi:hypothetical protein